MGLTLQNIVPWGRSLHEYTQMFQLEARDLARAILDCGSGPASFNAEATRQGCSVMSCDPIYQFGAEAIAQRIQETYDVIVSGVEAHRDAYVWDAIRSPQHLGEVRLQAMERFLADFPLGQAAGRYRTDALPSLSFGDRQFDLALCSHLLFSYSDHLPLAFHQAAIAELLRVAAEVRIFPVLTLDGRRSPWLDPVIESCAQQGYAVSLKKVSYEFQRGGNEMLRLSRAGTP